MPPTEISVATYALGSTLVTAGNGNEHGSPLETRLSNKEPFPEDSLRNSLSSIRNVPSIVLKRLSVRNRDVSGIILECRHGITFHRKQSLAVSFI